jgi:hypothetical protein
MSLKFSNPLSAVYLLAFEYLVPSIQPMKNYITFFVLGMFLVSCNSKPSLKQYMTDTWQTSYLKIEMLTHEKSDSTHVFEDKFENDPAIIAQSKYNKDGTFVAWYLNREGKKLDETPGTWKVEGDSLYIAYDYQGKSSKIAYHIQRTKEGFEATSQYDWDNDGEFDDVLLMKTKRIVLE